MTLKIDQILASRYQVVSLLAHGGMGSVYQAHDLVLDREVAVKQLQLDPFASERAIEQIREQFQREARILASLDHPNLPRVTDHFTEDGVEYLVMDYVAGQSLQDLIEDSRTGLSESQVLDWAEQLLSALDYIHHHGIIHRDVKPSNIRLTPDGHIFLVDFGLVKFYDPDNPRTATIMHGLGTPEYAPPEQYDVQLRTYRSPIGYLRTRCNPLPPAHGSGPSRPLRNRCPILKASSALERSRPMSRRMSSG